MLDVKRFYLKALNNNIPYNIYFMFYQPRLLPHNNLTPIIPRIDSIK